MFCSTEMKSFSLVTLALCVTSSVALPYGQFVDRFIKAGDQFAPPILSPRLLKYEPGLPGGFKCPSLAASSTIPTNARLVRPADIKVVAALGDSLTAANGVLATTVAEVAKQHRGLSWSIGGDRDINSVLTLPNILKKYNSRLYGFSLGSSYSEDTPDAFYNVASGGDRATDMPFQSLKLVSKVQADGRQNEWKLITLFIGGNDVCDYCNNPVLFSPENFKRNIQNAVDTFYANFRNTIVSLISPIDMTQVVDLDKVAECRGIHRSICSCLFNASDPDYARRISRAYQSQIEQIVAEAPARYPRIDFAVSYQPQFVNAKLPMIDGLPDISYFSPDCFHFNQKGHEHSAITLWNNMLKPVAQRATNLQFDDRSMSCPTEESPYLQI